MKRRKLDGVYFRIKNDNGEFENVCFSDMTEEQQDEILKQKDKEWLRNLCKILAKCIKDIGEQFDIVSVHGG